MAAKKFFAIQNFKKNVLLNFLTKNATMLKNNVFYQKFQKGGKIKMANFLHKVTQKL
jgi:hypothetical protein